MKRGSLLSLLVPALALIGMGIFAARAGVPSAWNMMPFWMVFAAVSLVALGLLLGNMKTVDGSSERKERA